MEHDRKPTFELYRPQDILIIPLVLFFRVGHRVAIVCGLGKFYICFFIGFPPWSDTYDVGYTTATGPRSFLPMFFLAAET